MIIIREGRERQAGLPFWPLGAISDSWASQHQKPVCARVFKAFRVLPSDDRGGRRVFLGPSESDSQRPYFAS